MVLFCTNCNITLKDGEMFCPECGASGELLDESKKRKKSVLDKDIFEYLSKKFDDVYALGYNNVKKIDIYDERAPSNYNIKSRWLKESSSLILKEGKAFLSVESMPKTDTPPVVYTGNVLTHSIADSALVKFKGRKEEVEYILNDENLPRYLLIIIPDPEKGTDSSKELQSKIVEQLIKEMNFLESSSLTNFKICMKSEFEIALNHLIEGN